MCASVHVCVCVCVCDRESMSLTLNIWPLPGVLPHSQVVDLFSHSSSRRAEEVTNLLIVNLHVAAEQG